MSDNSPTPLPDITLAGNADSEEGDLYERHHLLVDKGQESIRIDRYLADHLSSVSRNKIQAAIKAGCVQVGGRNTKSNYKVKPLDDIRILLPEPAQEVELRPEAIPLHIVYEDASVLVVDKPAGLVVHPGYGNFDGTLLNGLLYHLQEANRTTGGNAHPYLVHRIDKDTSGLLLVAKSEEAQVILAKQFFHHTIERRYYALVWGNFDEESGTIVGRIGRSAKDRRVMDVYPDDPNVPDEQQYGKHAVTHWSVVERFGYITAIECVLETGRTHQIRAHMRHIGHPLFNDTAYGGHEILKGTTFSKYKQFVTNCFERLPRQALHARVLGFVHPVTGEHMHFESPLPADMAEVCDRWRRYTTGSSNQEI